MTIKSQLTYKSGFESLHIRWFWLGTMDETNVDQFFDIWRTSNLSFGISVFSFLSSSSASLSLGYISYF
jgi:hypothetical protein